MGGGFGLGKDGARQSAYWSCSGERKNALATKHCELTSLNYTDREISVTAGQHNYCQ